jgi:hypothetical protein
MNRIGNILVDHALDDLYRPSHIIITIIIIVITIIIIVITYPKVVQLHFTIVANAFKFDLASPSSTLSLLRKQSTIHISHSHIICQLNLQSDLSSSTHLHFLVQYIV